MSEPNVTVNTTEPVPGTLWVSIPISADLVRDAENEDDLKRLLGEAVYTAAREVVGA